MRHFVWYQFSGWHSLLNGIFPFYLPVYLWAVGKSIAEIAYFIGLSGVGFCLTLWAFDRLRERVHGKWLLGFSFAIEVLLLVTVKEIDRPDLFVLLGFANGAYNCFFRVIQRLYLAESVASGNAGNRFGRCQIIRASVLKIAVLLGGIILDQYGYDTVFVFSVLVAVLGCANFAVFQEIGSANMFRNGPPLRLEDILLFRDRFGSRYIFAIDGVFLFLERYFWLLSLFFIARQSFASLGVLILALAGVCGLVFRVLKNKIDWGAGQSVYVWAVLLYAGSWLLRATLSDSDGFTAIAGKLVVITFCTSFFRLAFNNRFFALANHTRSQHYIFLNSYYSQFCQAAVMISAAFLLPLQFGAVDPFSGTYWFAGVLSVSYITYSALPEQRLKEQVP